jgi:hypothetical protein
MRFNARNIFVLITGGGISGPRDSSCVVTTGTTGAGHRNHSYKSPSCRCCGNWIDHLRANGFRVAVRNVKDLSQTRSKYGVTPELAACHTAVVDDYVVAGHVPADVIQRLLAEQPSAVGIAVPGMPPGSPGVEVGYSQPQGKFVLMDNPVIQKNNMVIPVGKPESSRHGGQCSGN